MKKAIRVAVNGYGVIGKRVADAVAKMAVRRGMPLFGAAPEHARCSGAPPTPGKATRAAS